MVFFTKKMTRTVVVAPAFLGAGLRDSVRQQLIAEVEGMPLDDAGFIITVLNVAEEGLTHGLIDHFTGSVKYTISYTALMFRPFLNEVVDTVVKSVSELGIFAEAGPLSVFISSVHIPSDMEFSPSDSAYTSAETGVRIRAEAGLRVKIIGSSVLPTTCCAIGTINEPFLGLLTS